MKINDKHLAILEVIKQFIGGCEYEDFTTNIEHDIRHRGSKINQPIRTLINHGKIKYIGGRYYLNN